jgi:Xaa-Pro dipeptidase
MVQKNNFEKFYERISQEWRGALISPGSNFYYLTGLSPVSTLERLFLLIVPVGGEPVILAPKLYEEEVKASWIKNTVFWEDKDDPYQILNNILSSMNSSNETQKWLVEDTMSISVFLKIQKMTKNIEFEPLSSVVSKLRIIKSKEEIEFHKKAGDIVDKVFYEIIEEGIEGKTEKEAAARIEYLLKSFGADEIAFDPIVASGPNGANPHHAPSDRVIKRGDLVVIDYGAKYKGYCSDITRTIAIGEISEEAKRVYEVVMEAQQQGINVVKEGITASEVDLTVRNVIEGYGYGEYFIHRTGHGLGLEVHEEPYIAPKSETFLREGMVFTVEPGIYLPGKFGVRIENDVAVTNGIGEKLTRADIQLIVL